MWFESEDSEAVKKMSETVAETRDELLSIASGMKLSPLTVGKSNLTNRAPANNRTAGGFGSPS